MVMIIMRIYTLFLIFSNIKYTMMIARVNTIETEQTTV